MKQFELQDLVLSRSPSFTLEIEYLSLERGEKVAVVGPNGSGKTTLLRIMGFLERPDSWSKFTYLSRPYGAGSVNRRGLGLLMQQSRLFRGTVTDNLAYPLRLRRVPPVEIAHRVDSMLGLMRLEQLASSNARSLSGGEQRRLALGRVLIGGQETLLLDEPVAHLDARSRAVIETVLADTEQTILLTTHDELFAHRVADRVVGLATGHLTASPSMNVLEGTLKEGSFITVHGNRIPVPNHTAQLSKGRIAIAIDPSKLMIYREPPATVRMNQLSGRLSSIRARDEHVWLEIDCGDRLTAVMSRDGYEEDRFGLYDRVFCCFAPEAIDLL